MLRLLTLLLLGVIPFSGCAPVPAAAGHGPAALSELSEEPWPFQGSDVSRKLLTPHYVLHTTLRDDDLAQRIAQLMEGALSEYRQVAPDVPISDRPLSCFMFENRTDWARFTRENTGQDAPIYLHINRGGYTAGDWYVAYFIGDLGTFSVASHEGFHQFVARHFKTRPPPFLEEGLACTFENVYWERDLPRWEFSVNHARQTGLRHALSGGRLLPLEKLCQLHAGLVVNTSPGQIEAFYAQSWAFALFCREGEGGKYRQGLEKLLADSAAGHSGSTPETPGGRWDPASAKPLLEHYLGLSLAELDDQFRALR